MRHFSLTIMMARALKFSGLLWLCLVGTALVQAKPQPTNEPERVINTCDDLTKIFSLELTGTNTVLRKLSCDPPVVVVVKDHAILRSDDVIDSTGIYFRVPESTRLTIAAPAIKIHDSTGSRQPLFFVEGLLDFRVTSWTPSLTSGTVDDEHHKLNVVRQGAVSSDGIIKFTQSSLLVGKQAAQQAAVDEPEGTPSPAGDLDTSQLSTVTTDAAVDPTAPSKDDQDVREKTKEEIGLAAYIVYRNYIDSIQGNEKMVQVSTAHPDDLASDGREILDEADGMEAKPTAGDDSASDLTTRKEDGAELAGSVGDTSVGVPQPQVVVSPTADPSDNSAGDLTGMTEENAELTGGVDDTSAGGADPEAETSPASAEKTVDKAAAVHDADDGTATTAEAASADPTSSPGQDAIHTQAFEYSTDVIDSVINDIIASFPGGVFSGQQDSTTPTLEPEVKDTDKDDRAISGDGDEASSPSSPAILPVHPESSLKPGQRLSGILRSIDGSASIYASAKDGSVMHERSEGEGPSFDLDGQAATATSTSSVTSTLISSNPRKVAKALRIREDTVEEDNAMKLAEAGEGGKGGKVVAKVMSWMPFGKNGFIRRNQRKNARDHMGEVEISITTRGNVQVSMDGTTVLKKGGPSFLGFRAKDPSYELRTTTEGLEIWKRGQLDWTVELGSF